MNLDVYPLLRAAETAPLCSADGRVKEAVGQLLTVEGITAAVGSELEVVGPQGRVRLEVLGFRGEHLLAAPLAATEGIAPGNRVRLVRRTATVPVGDALLGRIVDAFGMPIDGGPRIATTSLAPLRAPPPAPFARAPIVDVLPTGVRAIDALLPLGRGQRIGLFAGAGVGKSTLLGMMCKRADVDVVVAGLIGERGRELGDFVRVSLGDGLAKSVVVAATSDTPPLVRARGALAATAIAEHFRDRGLNVLLVMDSLTRFAMALREATLAAGEPPLTKGYTPSVFAALPALLERAGRGPVGSGSITAIYTVLVEGDEMTDPIADAVRGILDGHLVLARGLADRGLFPAIDVLRSISRVAHDVASREQLSAIARLRDLMSAEEKARDLVSIGAYVPGTDKAVDLAREIVPIIEDLVRQSSDEAIELRSSLAALHAVAERAR
jgi:flagellum-specific ATP synthase